MAQLWVCSWLLSQVVGSALPSSLTLPSCKTMTPACCNSSRWSNPTSPSIGEWLLPCPRSVCSISSFPAPTTTGVLCLPANLRVAPWAARLPPRTLWIASSCSAGRCSPPLLLRFPPSARGLTEVAFALGCRSWSSFARSRCWPWFQCDFACTFLRVPQATQAFLWLTVVLSCTFHCWLPVPWSLPWAVHFNWWVIAVVRWSCCPCCSACCLPFFPRLRSARSQRVHAGSFNRGAWWSGCILPCAKTAWTLPLLVRRSAGCECLTRAWQSLWDRCPSSAGSCRSPLCSLPFSTKLSSGLSVFISTSMKLSPGPSVPMESVRQWLRDEQRPCRLRTSRCSWVVAHRKVEKWKRS